MPSKTVSIKPKAYLKARHDALRKAMRALKIDVLLLTHPADLAYATDFTGEDSIGVLSARDFVLVTDFRFQEQAQIECGWLKTVLRDGKMTDALTSVLARMAPERIGFEANYTPYGTIHALGKAIAEYRKNASGKAAAWKKPEFVPLENVLVGLRKVKDDHEVKILRGAVEVAEEAFLALREAVEPGQTENYLAGLLVMELRARGASDSSFPVIVAAGANSSLPHYRPREVVVRKNAPLLIDWGARYAGYCSDLTRTLLIGRVSSQIREIYKVVLDAQLAAIASLRPGVKTVEVDKVARDLIGAAGYGERFGHGLGHGIGRDIHEGPGLRKSGPGDELRPGMVVTVEPGIYLPGVGGVRIEDDVLITHSGCEVLSSLSKKLEDNVID